MSQKPFSLVANDVSCYWDGIFSLSNICFTSFGTADTTGWDEVFPLACHRLNEKKTSSNIMAEVFDHEKGLYRYEDPSKTSFPARELCVLLVRIFFS